MTNSILLTLVLFSLCKRFRNYEAILSNPDDDEEVEGDDDDGVVAGATDSNDPLEAEKHWLTVVGIEIAQTPMVTSCLLRTLEQKQILEQHQHSSPLATISEVCGPTLKPQKEYPNKSLPPPNACSSDPPTPPQGSSVHRSSCVSCKHLVHHAGSIHGG